MECNARAKSVCSVKNGIAVGAVTALCLLAAWNAPDSTEAGRWYSILPPLLAVSLAVMTGQIMLSLVTATLIGGLLLKVPEAPYSLSAWGRGFSSGAAHILSSATDWVNIQILAFVVFVIAMISVMIVAGGMHGIVLWLQRFAAGSCSSQLVTALLGLAIFIDDYANTMIVGCAMRPVTDRYRVSREKLAFLVDATSAPVTGLAVLSTWVGYEVGLFDEVSDTLAMQQDGFSMLFDSLPFRFYCVLMIIFVLLNVSSRRDFGPMRAAQDRAQTTGQLLAPDAKPLTSRGFSAASPDSGAVARASAAVLPMAGLFLFLIAGIWIDGGGGSRFVTDPLSLFSFRAWRDVISTSENNILLLAWASIVGLVLSIMCARAISRLRFSLIGKAVLSGARSSLLPLIILTLAWSLKAACDGLHTGEFLVATLGGVVSPIWFPPLIFIAASLASFATGTSLGTMAILIPTAVPIAFSLEDGVYGPVTVVTLAAILDGAILGDHCSPISDTTIMSSISSACDHIHHVRTQLPYSLIVGALALICGYVPVCLWDVPFWIGMGTATALIALLFYLLPRQEKLGET